GAQPMLVELPGKELPPEAPQSLEGGQGNPPGAPRGQGGAEMPRIPLDDQAGGGPVAEEAPLALETGGVVPWEEASLGTGGAEAVLAGERDGEHGAIRLPPAQGHVPVEGKEIGGGALQGVHENAEAWVENRRGAVPDADSRKGED